MSTELTNIPFDHYQRYAVAADLVQAVLPDGGTVLEVGANRQRLLGDFLPRHSVLYTDLEPQQTPDFVIADACALPFAARTYEAVLSLDVLEHIPAEKRAIAVGEMARVAARIVVICCPTDRPWVHQAEQEAHEVWKTNMGGTYPWLEEHKEFGLVEPREVEQTLQVAGFQVHRFGQGDAQLWSAMMGAHFAKEAVPDLAPLVSVLDRFYNQAVFVEDRGDMSYRDVFVGLRSNDDSDLIATKFLSNAGACSAGADLLRAIGPAMHPLVARTLEAEKEWSKTSTLLQAAEQRAAEQFHRANQADANASKLLQAAEQRAAEQFHRANQADANTLVQLDRAQVAIEQSIRLEQQLLASEFRAVEQLQRADAADRKCVELEAGLARSRADAVAMEVQVSGERAEMRSKLDELDRERDTLQEHVLRLANRAAVLERRQRWLIPAVGLLCTILVLSVYYALI